MVTSFHHRHGIGRRHHREIGHHHRLRETGHRNYSNHGSGSRVQPSR